MESVRSPNKYRPNLGFLGDRPVRVPNYLFRSDGRRPHSHARGFVRAFLSRPPEEHYRRSHRLTRFLRQRGMTFQKRGPDGAYRIFTVPVTSTVVPLPKSSFNSIEEAASLLVVSLRRVLQSLYGAASLNESSFAEYLPAEARALFLEAAHSSPHYLPRLHHPVMAEYPFMEQVGIDLVLVEEYLRDPSGFSRRVRDDSRSGRMPFRMLELNAGSPSGASNNLSILEGLYREDPELLEALGPMMPNDHFQVLRDVYQNIGRFWTGREDGVQVVLPPGGANGAAPEIHEISRLSGLPYCDSGQLFRDEQGWIRLRTLDGSNPAVTAIYSRVNADSALYDPEEGIHLRDPETGEPLYCLDVLKPWESGKPEYLKDQRGRPLLLESEFSVPGALKAIHERKLYLGGLNRVLDNKMILSILVEYAPGFAREALKRHGLEARGLRMEPPEMLPSKPDSVTRLHQAPEEWVVKAPNLSGGSGIHILGAMDPVAREEVLDRIRTHPDRFAYQRLVRIGRIPVAMRGPGKRRVRFANLAADIRMWMFFGADGARPRLTHNALVRVAPEERGAMSSIVNTSLGGGYAPFVIVDDIGSGESVPASRMARPPEPLRAQCGIPAFAAAQVLRVIDLWDDLRRILAFERAERGAIFPVLGALSTQMREVASYFDPEAVETVQTLWAMAGRGDDPEKRQIESLEIERIQAEVVSILPNLAGAIDEELSEIPRILRGGAPERAGIPKWIRAIRRGARRHPALKRDWTRLERAVRALSAVNEAEAPLSDFVRRRMLREMSRFRERALQAFLRSGSEVLLPAFEADCRRIRPYRETAIFEKPGVEARFASEWEWRHQRSLAESEWIDPGIQRIRREWMEIRRTIDAAPAGEREERIHEARVRHFRKHPLLAEFQRLIDQRSNRDPELIREILRVLPYAAWNLGQASLRQGSDPRHLFRLLDPRAHRGGGGAPGAAGECFIRKKTPHGLLSEGSCQLWISAEQSPFVQGYTLGHELIHRVQLEDMMEREREALREGPLAFAAFLRDYGVFHAYSLEVREGTSQAGVAARAPLYGLADRMASQFFSPVIREVRASLAGDGRDYPRILSKYGGWFACMMPATPPVLVKAAREVWPTLENAKNLIFAEECGLETGQDLAASALPAANRAEIRVFRPVLERAVREFRPRAEDLRKIASLQLHGVGFAETESDEFEIPPLPAAIRLHPGYNQTEQQ